MTGLDSNDLDPYDRPRDGSEDPDVPTPDFEVTDTGDPNPADGDVNDTPPAGRDVAAEGAVDAEGRMLDADGNPVPPRQAEVED